jgi:L-asparaginase II
VTERFAPIAVTTRSGIVESLHYGALVALDRDGSVAFSIGDPSTIVYPRSSMKPLQATAMVASGLTLPAYLLAVVCASHDGRPEHLAAVTDILGRAGVNDSALANVVDYPLDAGEAEAAIRAGRQRSSLQMNCSGKHSGMLLTCHINEWPTDASYLNVDHPLQQRITDAIPSLAGEPAAHALSLVGLARAFRTIAMARPTTPAGTVADAIRRHPEMLGGPTRDITRLLQGVPGMIGKDGAEAVYAVALPDGRAVALKIADGANRARPPVMRAALERLGVDISGVDPATWEQPILGHGKPVGVVRALTV